jgi:biopolymer transport protein ExbB
MAFAILLNTIWMLGKDWYRKDFASLVEQWMQNPSLFKKGQQGVLIQILQGSGLTPSRIGSLSSTTVFRKLQSSFVKKNAKLSKGMHMVSVLSAITPLLGLLGTVTGMVSTFDVITIYGNSNPVLMADGISEALITTQSGLVLAFPLVLLKHRVEGRITWIQKEIEVAIKQVISEAEK